MNKQLFKLEHKSILFQSLFEIQIPLSEYSFSNLFLFRAAHNYHIIDIDGDLFISGVTYDNKTYIMPTTTISLSNDKYFQKLIDLLKNHDYIFPIPDEWLCFFPESEFTRISNDDDTDYIYNIEKFRNYAGRKLHSKKNLLNQFIYNYTPSMERFTKENIHIALDLLDMWQSESGIKKNETDYTPCVEAIENFEELKLCGGIFKADEKPAGFLIGEEINSEMYGIHFAKGLKSIKGISQYMFSQCSEIHIGMYKYINLEQDMGKENLRITKSSYLPDTMAKKYRISLKK